MVVYFLYPETQGVPLEEMDAIFGDAGAPVPQHMGADEEEEFASPAGSDPEVNRVRRSISTHPRFLDAVEHTAHGAASPPALPRAVAQLWDSVVRRSTDRGHYTPLTEPS